MYDMVKNQALSAKKVVFLGMVLQGAVNIIVKE
jgi:hypothetical protein